MDEYIRDIIDSRRSLIVERAVDEDLQAEKELSVEVNTVAGKFVDGFITQEEIDGCQLTEEELNGTLDDIIDDAEANELALYEPETFSDDDGELSDINAILDSDIDPELLELDDDESMYCEPSVD
jgi:hypothetical protein